MLYLLVCSAGFCLGVAMNSLLRSIEAKLTEETPPCEDCYYGISDHIEAASGVGGTQRAEAKGRVA